MKPGNSDIPPSPIEGFAAFAQQCCRNLIADLAQALEARVTLEDLRGTPLLVSGPGAPPGTDTAQRVPIPGTAQALGFLAVSPPAPQAARLIAGVAVDLGRRFCSAQDLELTRGQIAHHDDEIGLLRRFASILTPEDEYPALAQRLLDETAALLPGRLLLHHDEEEQRLLSSGSEAAPKAHEYLAANPALLAGLHLAGRDSPGPRLGVLDTDAGTLHYATAVVHTPAATGGLVGLLWDAAAGDIDTGELRLLECLASELSNAAATRRLSSELRAMLFNTVRSLVAAVDAKDEYTRGHSERVYRIALLIAERMHLSPGQLRTLTWAALLHDIGKIAITGDILNKPGPLTEDEYALVKTHPLRGCDVLEPIPQLREVLPAIRHHHERYDGHGYPDGLRGEAIPHLARIIAAADALDAMVSTRAYRTARTRSQARRELRDCTGSQFDPEVARILIALDDSNALDSIIEKRSEPDAA